MWKEMVAELSTGPTNDRAQTVHKAIDRSDFPTCSLTDGSGWTKKRRWTTA